MHSLTAELLESHSHAFRIPLHYSMYKMYMEHTQLKTIPISPKIEIATLLTVLIFFFYHNSYENEEANKNAIPLTESTALL